jgi:myo-inositol-1-phosphate synthase
MYSQASSSSRTFEGGSMSNGRKVRVGIIGVGNCASSLVQGVQFYRDAPEDAFIPGLMHTSLGGLHVRDIEFSAAFDINRTKVGADLGDAVFADPNNTIKFADVPRLGVTVQRGVTHDGLGEHLSRVIRPSDSSPTVPR